MQTKIRQLFTLRRFMASGLLIALVVMSWIHGVDAQQFIQGYGVDQPLERGMVVRLDPDEPEKIIPLRAGEAEEMHGVVVDPNDAPATLSTDTQKTFVTVSGKFDVLVSDQNGSVETGDYLSISSIEGIAMKADRNTAVVVGKALGSFDGGQNGLSAVELDGRTVRIGRVLTDVNVAANPLYRPDETYVPALLRSFAEAVNNEPVSPMRLYVALLMLLASLLVAGIVLYSGVKGGLVAIGRNPLSRQAITRNMVKVVVTGILIFACGLFAVYLLLKL